MSKNELMKDYRMLGKMSSLLDEHQKDIKVISKTIARRMKSNMRYELVDNLELTLAHMEKAKKEIRKAQNELRLI